MTRRKMWCIIFWFNLAVCALPPYTAFWLGWGFGWTLIAFVFWRSAPKGWRT